MGRKLIDLTGKKFGRLTVTGVSHTKHYKNSSVVMWSCDCDCGNKTTVAGSSLRTGNTKSCGCIISEKMKKNGTTYRNGVPNSNRKRYNRVRVDGDKTYLYTSNDDEIVLDTISFVTIPQISNNTWCVNGNGYPMCIDRNTKKHMELHKFIMPQNTGMEIDHIDGNPLNNTRANLRVVTRSQNSMNRRIMKNNKSGVTGVRQLQNGSWWAGICVRNQRIYLGTYKKKEDAVAARKEAEAKHFGKYARGAAVTV